MSNELRESTKMTIVLRAGDESDESEEEDNENTFQFVEDDQEEYTPHTPRSSRSRPRRASTRKRTSRSQKRRSDATRIEEEELLDFAFIESGVSTVPDVVAPADAEEEPKAGEEELFLIRDFLYQTQDVPVYPRLMSFGTIPVNEMTEEESLLHFREQLLRLSELYRSQFRRLYDALQTSYKTYRVQSREILFTKRMEQGGYSASSTTDAGGYGLTISAPSSVNPTSMSTDDKESLQRREEEYFYSSIMRDVRKYGNLFREEVAARKRAEEEYSTTPAPRRYPRAQDEVETIRAPACCLDGCHMRKLPPSSYCYAHILADVNQKMFVGCTYRLQGGKACKYPILIGQTLCAAHADLPYYTPPHAQPSSGQDETDEPESHQEPGEQKEKSVLGKRSTEEFLLLQPPPSVDTFFASREEAIRSGPEL